MDITAALVKELRERTGAGMMDCKKALLEVSGDMDKAIEFLREKGLAAAAKKAGRIAAEGVVDALILDDGRSGVMAEINCETDFVAKTDNFKSFARNVVEHIYAKKPEHVSAEELEGAAVPADAGLYQKVLLDQSFSKDESKTVRDLISDATVAIGEKIAVRRFVRYATEEGSIDSYIHMGGKIGVLLEMKASQAAVHTAAFKEMSHDICMHIAAANPRFVNKAEVPVDNLNKEKEILRAQALNEGKPEKIVDKMVEGRIEKYYKEVCLLEQPFVKDPDISIAAYVSNTAKAIEAEIQIIRFSRFERGEGIEKRQDNLAEAVAAQVAKL
jgi:elongation factor Ts